MEVAECLIPQTEGEDFEAYCNGPASAIEYSVSEMIRNVIQHSHNIGFVCAQYYEARDLVRVSISDIGIGIKNSFLRNESPHCYTGMDDLGAINLALQPQVSSRLHLGGFWGETVNAGVGLSLLNAIAKSLGGFFMVMSGHGCYTTSGEWQLPDGHGFPGTICNMTYPRAALENFTLSLEKAKQDLGLLGRDGTSDFEGMFQ